MRTSNIFPGFVVHDVPDICRGSVVFGTESLQCNPASRELVSNRLSLLFGELGEQASLAPRKSPVSPGVLPVGEDRIPPEIFGTIVGRIAVVMAALHSFRARANKCLKKDPVQQSGLISNTDSLATIRSRHFGKSTPDNPRDHLLLRSSLEARPRTSIGANPVAKVSGKSAIFDDWRGNILLGHGIAPRKRFCVKGGASVPALVPPASILPRMEAT